MASPINMRRCAGSDFGTLFLTALLSSGSDCKGKCGQVRFYSTFYFPALFLFHARSGIYSISIHQCHGRGLQPVTRSIFRRIGKSCVVRVLLQNAGAQGPDVEFMNRRW